MGHRTVKRVPLDFDWPLNRVWEGYTGPELRPCPAGDECINGSNPDRAWLDHWVHLLLVAADSPNHPWVAQLPLTERPPTGRLVEITTALAGRAPSGPFGHDAIDRWRATNAILQTAGLDDDWGTCPECQGRAYHPDDVALEESWEAGEPPTGPGWQLWETVSEGSPVSPVFATAEELASWCSSYGTLFADMGATYDQWLSMIQNDGLGVGSLLVVTYPAQEGGSQDGTE